MDERSIPEDVIDKDDAHEMIRFWVLDGESHVSLKIGLFDPEDEAYLWGSMMADIAMHAARGMMQDRPDIGNKAQVLAQIDIGYRRRLDEFPEFSGQIQGAPH